MTDSEDETDTPNNTYYSFNDGTLGKISKMSCFLAIIIINIKIVSNCFPQKACFHLVYI